MSMNLFLQAFPKDAIEAMARDHELVDRWVWDESTAVLATDIGTAWDVLNHLLEGSGFVSSRSLEGVLSNGCELLYPELVREHAESLASLSPEYVIESLREVDEDLYHLEVYQDDEDGLAEEFSKLSTFYRQAAEQGLGVVYYAA
jgi:hypothetical protein